MKNDGRTFLCSWGLAKILTAFGRELRKLHFESWRTLLSGIEDTTRVGSAVCPDPGPKITETCSTVFLDTEVWLWSYRKHIPQLALGDLRLGGSHEEVNPW
jgi:hypothetical protein